MCCACSAKYADNNKALYQLYIYYLVCIQFVLYNKSNKIICLVRFTKYYYQHLQFLLVLVLIFFFFFVFWSGDPFEFGCYYQCLNLKKVTMEIENLKQKRRMLRELMRFPWVCGLTRCAHLWKSLYLLYGFVAQTRPV